MAMDRTDIETGRLLSAVVTWPEAQLTEHGTACLGSLGEFGLNRLLIRETLLNARPCLQARVVRLGSLCISLSPVRTAFRGGSTRKNGRQQL